MKSLNLPLSIVLAALLSISAYAEVEQVQLKVGDEAPDFSLPGTDGNTHKLSDLLEDGPVVLAWFPKADTPGCTEQCKSLTKNGHLIREFDVSYFMASVDPIEDNKKFAEKYHADFAILSDATKQTAMEYGVMSDWGFSNRHTFYIGTDGKILRIDRKVNVSTCAEDTAAALEALNVSKVESS